MAVVKIIEMMGGSKKSFNEAILQVLKRAKKTIRHITGADVIGQKIVLKEGKIIEYRVHLKIAFVVED